MAGRPSRPDAQTPSRGGRHAAEHAPGSPPDAHQRERIEREFHTNLLVEAGAGSGKTRSLTRRMAGGIAAGVYTIDAMAAVTFTRKAASELRGRFQEALEARLADERSGDARERLEHALRNIERLFAGTIHAFCARILRERPVEARMAPGFIEIDEARETRLRKQAWRDFIVRERAAGATTMLDLQAAGLRPQDLDTAFAIVCQHEDVAFPAERRLPPEAAPVWSALERFATAVRALVPQALDPDSKCDALALAREFEPRLMFALRWRRHPAALAELLGDWQRVHVTQKWWKGCGPAAKSLVQAFQQDVVDPFLLEWRQYVYAMAVGVLSRARAYYADTRRRHNVVNYVDLLLVTARLLRENGDVRRALQRKYRWFFIDEFQDTDPIQAEIFLSLASEEPGLEPDRAHDPWHAPLRAGALFVVGDPKQSIYRFRRADIDIYNRVRERIRDGRGEVLHLTANWRSVPGVCDLANHAFPTLFPAVPTRESPAFEPLAPMRTGTADVAATGAARLVAPASIADRSGSWPGKRNRLPVTSTRRSPPDAERSPVSWCSRVTGRVCGSTPRLSMRGAFRWRSAARDGSVTRSK
jgi:ATP-dependent helicase/nuclease subunit A